MNIKRDRGKHGSLPKRERSKLRAVRSLLCRLFSTNSVDGDAVLATLVSELDSEKLAKGRLERYANEAGDFNYASDPVTLVSDLDNKKPANEVGSALCGSGTDSVIDPALKTNTIRLRQKAI